MPPISLREPNLLCVVILTASMELHVSGEIFAVRHSPYAVSKFELGRPSEHGKMAGNIFVTNNNMNMKKDNENSRPLNLVRITCLGSLPHKEISFWRMCKSLLAKFLVEAGLWTTRAFWTLILSLHKWRLQLEGNMIYSFSNGDSYIPVGILFPYSCPRYDTWTC